MKKRVLTYRFYIHVILFVGIAICGCTEPFSPQLLPQTESVLVVDATLTNESKIHEILLSRSTQEQGSPQVEQNATITVLDDNQQAFIFTETEPGKYISDFPFKADAGRTYRLQITTADGKSYTSNTESLPQTNQIENIEFEKTTTESGNNGVIITVDSFDPTGNSTYYRYEYEETYKVIAPEWRPNQLVVLSDENRSVEVARRDPNKEEQICYVTDKSNSILITKTSGVDEDRVSDFDVRFLNKENFIIAHRYSILIKQYILSQQSFSFYEKLKDFSESESLFSQSQPGFINGNIFPDDDSNERVVGIFEVSSVSEKRVFFNYTDFFPEEEELPPFFDECQQLIFEVGVNSSLYEFVKSKRISYVREISDPQTGALEAYEAVPRVCGDCTVLGSAEVPDFWQE